MRLVVGRVGRAHGIRGAVTVELHTDSPEARFAPGESVFVDPGGAGLPALPARLTVSGARWHSGRFVVTFVDVTERGQAEALRGAQLSAEVDVTSTDEPDQYHDQALIGLAVRDPAGALLGHVTDVVHLPAQDLLQLTQPGGSAVLVPFVAAIVPTVDLAGGYVVVTAPAGLLDSQ